MVLTRTGKSTRVKHQVNSTCSQTPTMGENEESSVDPHLKHIKNQKLMFESKIESCIELVVSGIDSGEDTKTLEETLSEIKELQEKLDNSVQELLDISPSEVADKLCFQLSKLKFKIRKTTAALRKHKKETQSAEVSNVSSGNLRVIFDSSSSNPTILNTNMTSTYFSVSAGNEGSDQLVSSDSAAPASSVQSNSISPPANMESNIGFSTATSSGNPVHSALSSEPFLANSNNSSVNQDTSFHISNSNPSWRFLSNQHFSDPLASTTLGSASYQNPISMSACFQKSVPKLQAAKFDGNPLHWVKWFSIFQATIDCSPMSLSEKMIHLQSLLTGEAKHLKDGYGCDGSVYVPALNCLEEHFGNRNRIVNAFLDKLSQFKSPNLTVPESYTQFSAFLLTLVDTFQQLGFNHDIHSTTNPNQALNKLPTPVRLDWNKYALEKFSLQPSPKDLSEWLSIYAKAYRDLPAPISIARPSHGRSNFAHKP